MEYDDIELRLSPGDLLVIDSHPLHVREADPRYGDGLRYVSALSDSSIPRSQVEQDLAEAETVYVRR